MAKLIYRVVAACGALGYGFPRASLRRAVKDGVDAIVADAGSMDAGPYYLGSGEQYFEREAVKADYRHMVEAGLTSGCPVILGSCGMAGGDRNLDWMLEVAKEVFEELDVRDAKVAVIRAQIDQELVIQELRAGRLLATGDGPELSETALRESTIVGQMGVHPIICALQSGARYIFAGRSCDVALFAADIVRRGIDAGLAFHVGHILECGALACDPGSPSDCLVAEIFDDGSAIFTAPEPDRRCTPYSIAAHSLYEESHPQLQFYPEGVLVMTRTEFFARGGRSAGIRSSRFLRAGKPWPWSIKLEGARWMGKRKVSLIPIDPAELPAIPPEILVFGRNGVERRPAASDEKELGVIVETTAATAEAATLLASLLTHYLLHYGYPGRKATAGNIAYPLSPKLISFARPDGTFGAIVPSGTRDPLFIESYPRVRTAVVQLVAAHFPEALANAHYRIIEADANAPVVLLRTIERDSQELAQRHAEQVAEICGRVRARPGALFGLDSGDAYEWSLYHLLKNEAVLKEQLFPITYYNAVGSAWVQTGGERPTYFDIGAVDAHANLNERTLSSISDAPPQGDSIGSTPLSEMAIIIRSKNAGVNRLTFDIVFNSALDYDAALRSNLFVKDNISAVLGVSAEQVIGSYFVDVCNAIKISISRANISGSSDERDVFGAQQQARLERLRIPLFSESLSECSTF
jgi:hypothetical protein